MPVQHNHGALSLNNVCPALLDLRQLDALKKCKSVSYWSGSNASQRIKDVTPRKSKRTRKPNTTTTNCRNAATRLKHGENAIKMALSSLSMATTPPTGSLPKGVETLYSNRCHTLQPLGSKPPGYGLIKRSHIN